MAAEELPEELEAASQDLAALIAENLRLKEELSRLSQDGYSLPKVTDDPPPPLYRPPWQCQAQDETLRPRLPKSQGALRIDPQVAGALERRSILSRNGAASAPSLGLGRGELASVEELRLALLQITGSLPESFKALDAKGTAMLDMPTLAKVLEDLQAKSGRSLPSAGALFDAMGLGHEEVLPIARLLEFNPPKQGSGLRQMDTQALWTAYAKEKSAHTRSLERRPAWKPNAKSQRALPPDSWAVHLEAVRRRRDFRKQFREDRQGIKPEQKRELILGVSPNESHIGMREQEHRNLEVHRQRIQNAIRGCSRARFHLVEIQKQMAGIVADKAEVTSALQGMFRNKLHYRNESVSEGEDSADERPSASGSADASLSGRRSQRSNRTVAFDVGRQQQQQVADEELSSYIE